MFIYKYCEIKNNLINRTGANNVYNSVLRKIKPKSYTNRYVQALHYRFNSNFVVIIPKYF